MKVKSSVDVISEALEKGKPLSEMAVAELRKADKADALRVNAHNIVMRMLAGDAITETQLKEAERYYPKEAQQWMDSGGTVKHKMPLEKDMMTLNACAKKIGCLQSTLFRMIQRHPDAAPKKSADGKYSLTEVSEFYAVRAHVKCKSSGDVKAQILEQELRLKKIKADEAEGAVIDRAAVVDILTDADYTLEQVLKQIIEKYVASKDREAALQNAKASFNGRWRKYIESLA